MYIPKMISLDPGDAEWIKNNNVNLSHYVRWALEVSRVHDEIDMRKLVERKDKAMRVLQRALDDITEVRT